MRYGDWDILLFPRDCKVPIKEFKVACHVVHDAEFTHGHGSVGVPTVCCFVPSLEAGSPFQVSIHSWNVPNISQFTWSYSKFPETVMFEARILVDGRLVASTTLDRRSTWPHVIAHGFEFSKNGDLECLKFPSFRQELLQQSYWSPADDVGRIKLVISEGFPRDSMSMPLERVKNIVAFSFQHAPLDILESSSIAWPNSTMWRRAPFTASMPVPAYPSNDSESHAHSPRRQPCGSQDGSSGYPMPIFPRATANAYAHGGSRQTVQAGCGSSSVPGNAVSDPFGDANAYFEWLSDPGAGMVDLSRAGAQNLAGRARNARKSSTDTSMPDYAPQSHGASSRTVPEQTQGSLGRRPEDDSIMSYLKVPTNTPTTLGQGVYEPEGIQLSLGPQKCSISPDLAHSLTNSLLNQSIPAQIQSANQSTHGPAIEVRSRKENQPHPPDDPPLPTMPSMPIAGAEHNDVRRVSQPMYIPSSAGLLVSTAAPQPNGPQAQPGCDSSRVASTHEFGADITNMPSTDAALPAAGGSSTDKGTKRVRNFTPASAKAIDEEDEPRRVSPRIRLSSFPDGTPDEGDK